MNTQTVTTIYSSEIQELQNLFNTFPKPYGYNEICRFNRAYQSIYPHLSRLERRRAEHLVDALIAGLAHEDLAEKIFGVV